MSAANSTEQRTKKSKSFEDTDLKKVIEEVAKGLGYTVSGEIEDIAFPYKRQRRERDLQFLKRLAEDYGYFFAIKDKQLVFYRREDLEEREAVTTFELEDGTTIINWKATDKTHQTYGNARVAYAHGKKKKLISGEVQDLSIRSGDTLTIDERVEDEAEAKTIARSRLAKANENGLTANLTIVGDPLMIAGQVVALGATFGKYAALYLVHKATHKIARGKYTTQLELKAIRQDGKVRKASGKGTKSGSKSELFDGSVQDLSKPKGETF